MMKFKDYLDASASGNIKLWIMRNKTTNKKFAKEQANIIHKTLSFEPCSLDVMFNINDNIQESVFGQFIVIESELSSNTGLHNKLFTIARYILRPKEDKEFDNEDTLKEEANTKAILNTPAKDILGAINDYMRIRNIFVHEIYNGVFYKAKREDEDDDQETDVSNDNDDGMYWQSLIRVLGKEDITVYPKIRMLKMKEVAPELSFLKKQEQKREYESRVAEIKRKAKNGFN